MSLFDLLSLLYIFLGLRAIFSALKNWRAFTDDQLTAFDRQLARDISFFVFVPITVFFHELGHALATMQVGGRVGEFHYAFFYGYVVPLGNFSALQAWWIALSGNLVSIAFGILPLALLPLARAAWQKFLALAFARWQLGWSLVGYPLLTLAGFQGDWIIIYRDISLLVAVPLFITHAALVIGLWQLDRLPIVQRYELNLYAGVRDQLRAFDAAIQNQRSTDAFLARGNFFAEQNQNALALDDYRAALKLDPQNPRVLFTLGELYLRKKNIRAAEKNFRAALARESELAAPAHYGLAMCYYQRGKLPDAARELDAAIARNANVAEFYFWRGTVRRNLRDDANARNDFARAAELAAISNPDLAARARELLANK